MAGTGCLSAQAEKKLPNNKVVNSFFMVICIYLNCKFSIYGLTNRYFLQSAFFICLPLNMTYQIPHSAKETHAHSPHLSRQIFVVCKSYIPKDNFGQTSRIFTVTYYLHSNWSSAIQVLKLYILERNVRHPSTPPPSSSYMPTHD